MTEIPRYDEILELYEGIIFTPQKAIRKFCLWCEQSPSGVRNCLNQDCPLYLYRMGKIPPGASRELVKVIHEYCHQCVKGHAEIRTCSAFVEYLGHPPCPLYVYRNGTNPNISAAKRQKQSELAKKRKPKRDSSGHFTSDKPDK